MAEWYPLLVLAIGLVIVIGGIITLRLHAFIALITAAVVVSLLAPGEWSGKIPRVADAFGSTAAGIGIVIALAAIIGMAMTASGAADRVVRVFLGLFGEKRGGTVLMASGFTLAIPVFFDTVFFLLVPLVRSMYRRTGRHYVKYLMAAGSCAAAHALVPPTPGPLIVAQSLGVDLGVMMLVGVLVALPAAAASLVFAGWADRRIAVDVPQELGQPARDVDAPALVLPPLLWSFAPIILPVLLIASRTIAGALGVGESVNGVVLTAWRVIDILGNPEIALLLSAAIALMTWRRHARPSANDVSSGLGEALMAGGVIVLITCAGGAFGASLRGAGLAPAIQSLAGDAATGGMGLLLLAFAVAALIKFAQGSSTASMIVTSAMFAAMLDNATLGFHPVYVATAIGSGSLVGSWMNDSGFWIFAKMGGLSELQTLKTWTPLLALIGIIAMTMTVILALLMPLTE